MSDGIEDDPVLTYLVYYWECECGETGEGDIEPGDTCDGCDDERDGNVWSVNAWDCPACSHRSEDESDLDEVETCENCREPSVVR